MLTPNPIQAAILAEDPKRALFGAGTGVGKTLLSLWLSEGKVLVVSPKTNRIDANFARDAKLLGIETPTHISKEDFKKNDPGPCDTLILDECFIAGTKIDTPSGQINIEDLVTGDKVYSALGEGFVTKTFSHIAKETVTLKLSSGKIITVTPSHPFYTSNRGWVKASELTNSDSLFSSKMVISNYGKETFVRKLWKADKSWMASRRTLGNIPQELFRTMPEGYPFKKDESLCSDSKREKTLYQVSGRIIKETKREPQYEQSKVSSEDERHPKKNRTQTSSKRWEWSKDARTAKEIIGSTWGWVVRGISCWYRKEKGGSTNLLQSRYCQSSKDDSYRNRRNFSFGLKSTKSRREENKISEEVRVESVEIQKSTGTRVYNISVSGHPSYIAGGVLVHNCEFAFGTQANTYSRGGVLHIKHSDIHESLYTYIQKYQPKRIYFLSATPVEKSMQAWSCARLLGVLKKPDFESFEAFRKDTHISRPRGYSTLWMEKKTQKATLLKQNFLRSFGYFGEASDKVPPIVINVPIELTEEQKQAIVATGEKYPEKKTTDEHGNVPQGAVDENSAVRNGIKFMIECGVMTEYVFDDALHTQKKITRKIPNNYLPKLLEIVKKEQNPIIFVEYKKQIDLIKEYLEQNTKCNVVMMNGSVKDSVKAEALRAIREDKNTIMIAQSAMSAGWETLISSATIFVSVKRWRHYQQGIGRNSRHQNRTEQKTVYRMYLGPTSQHIWEDIIDMRKEFNDGLK